jgi:osmotically-inducible protein OsmY
MQSNLMPPLTTAHGPEPSTGRLDHAPLGPLEGRSKNVPTKRIARVRELQRRVRDALLGSGYAALGFVGCDVQQNQVVLSGSVPSYHLKQLAQVFAQRVEGVGRVDNRLEVRGRRPAR